MSSKTETGKLVVGIDFGTSSVRVVILDTSSGDMVGSGESRFSRYGSGLHCDPGVNQYRQHPEDHLTSLTAATQEAIRALAPAQRDQVAAIGVDTTGSSPAPADKSGLPLSLHPEFANDPDAMVHLWKDTTAVEEAAEIAESAREWRGTNLVAYSASRYSPEWFWAKALHTTRKSKAIREAGHTWVEHCDWITALLTAGPGAGELRRSRCAAGHKAMWNTAFGGYPDRDYFAGLSATLAAIRDTLPAQTHCSTETAGRLSPEWAQRLGLPEQIPVAVGTFDAHAGAVGAGVRPGVPAKTIGTSSSDMVVADSPGSAPLEGIEGQAEGSIIPGMTGIEAGQAAFGDMFDWFCSFLLYPLGLAEDAGIVSAEGKEQFASTLMARLFDEAAAMPVGLQTVTALDWFNGRRAPDGDHRVRGALAGLGLATDPPSVFASLIQAAVFGTRRIHDVLGAQGVPVESLLTMGGVARKAPLVNQLLANTLSVPVRLCASDQTSARGAAIYASVAGGLFGSIVEAQGTLASPVARSFEPQPADELEQRYQRYRQLCENVQSWTDLESPG